MAKREKPSDMSLTSESEGAHETGSKPPVDWETLSRHVNERGAVFYNVSWRHRCALEWKLPWSHLILNMFARKLEWIVLVVTCYLAFTGLWPYAIVGFGIWYLVLFPFKRKSVIAAITVHAAQDREFFDLANQRGTFRLEP
ncbi:MAG: hypothetical protein OYM47_15545 [Gemmatimonadota bacterium]|nr:hypothetical protein [Gemmatimonadota bacterium]